MEKVMMVVVIVGVLGGLWLVLKPSKSKASTPVVGGGGGPVETDTVKPRPELPQATLVDETAAFGGGVGGTVTEFLRANPTEDVK